MKYLLFFTISILTLGLIPMWFNFGEGWTVIDFATQQIPFILETKRMLASGAPWWSWNTFAGDNFIGGYSFYTITSPFVWLTCLFPVDKILWGILLSLYLKTICTSLSAYLFFKELNFSKEYAILGSLLYTFSSFYLCNLLYFHFCEPIMVFPLLLIALEKVIQRQRYCWIWLAGMSFIVTFVNFYFAFSSFILGLLYLLFRGYGEKVSSVKLVSKSFLFVFLGIGVSSFILLPTIFHQIGGGRAESLKYFDFNINAFILSIINGLRTLIIPEISEGPHKGFFGSEIFCSQEPYITLFGVFPICLFLIKNNNWLSKLLLTLYFIYFTPLNGLFSGFTVITYQRWLYGLDLFSILAILYLIKSGKEYITMKALNRYLIICIGVILLTFIVEGLFSSRNGQGYRVTVNLRIILEIFIWILSLIFLYLWIRRNKSLRLGICGVALFGTLNLAATTFFYTKNPGDNQFSQIYGENCRDDFLKRDVFEAALMDGKSKEMTYRTDVESRYANYSLLHNLPGIYNFHSSMNKKLQPLRLSTGSKLILPNFLPLRNRHSFDILFSVKEVLDFHVSLPAKVSDGILKKEQNLQFDRYELENYIPFGFTYDTYILAGQLEKEIAADEYLDVPLMLLDNIAIKESDIKEVSKYLNRGKINKNISLDSISNIRKQKTVFDFKGDTKGFTCRSEFNNDEFVFFSVVADPGFTAYIDGVKTKIYEVNLGLSGIVIPKGNHKIEFKFLPTGLKCGIWISLICVMIIIGFWLSTHRKRNRF